VRRLDAAFAVDPFTQYRPAVGGFNLISICFPALTCQRSSLRLRHSLQSVLFAFVVAGLQASSVSFANASAIETSLVKLNCQHSL